MKLSRRSARSQAVNTDGHVIGLDIGATAVRAAVLALNGKGGGRPVVTVHGLGSAPLPPGAVVNGVVMEPAAVTAAIQTLWQTHKFKCRRVILGTSSPQAVVRPLQIPNLNAQQRAKALPFQAREIIALPLDEVVLDYAQIGDVDATTGMVSGLLIATPRRPVLAAVEAVQKAGLKVVRVDLSSFGALRSVATDALAVQAVVDIGAHLTSIVIHHDGVPRLVRTVARGGQELTDLLVENHGLPADEAERLKRETGMSGEHQAAAEVIRAGVRPLLAEIRSSVNYFRSANDGIALQGVVLTGGGAQLAGLADAVARQVGVATTIGSAMSAVSTGPVQPVGAAAGRPPVIEKPGRATGHDISGATAVSVGLALGAAA
ncbi:type IV pilus assembly protein PilM [Nakamurella deserti]|uniref:type IV pilus assembly protein PilM n=1 Tax=Nakamurella deserti TaxID=2164074 RepID=UPI000DBE0BB9|nr:type IV pilus assembly protein PilM [Nakamurella deserti]